MELSRFTLVAVASLAAGVLATGANDPQAKPPVAVTTAPAEDRVGLPKRYRDTFQIIRSVHEAGGKETVNVYANTPGASVKTTGDLPYPYGTVLVMETAHVLKGPDGQALRDSSGIFRGGEVLGLHVMRREKNFGEAYGANRTGEWEYVEYRADGTYITPPQKSFSCAECHVKAGASRDWVFRGRFGETPPPAK